MSRLSRANANSRSTFAPRGMVATPHTLATSTGVDILRRGGSAVDALIAANAVLAVVYPHWCGLGGDGFWLIYDPRQRRVQALNASGPAARAASRDFYRERGHTAIPSRGPLAALTVPGAIDGWRAAHERFGRLPWQDLFTDAIKYARDGAPAASSLVLWISRRSADLRRNPALASLFLPRGELPREGTPLVAADLARSLETLAREGARRGFYEGALAGRICAALAGGGSPLRADDFASFRAEWTDPIAVRYRGYTVHELPPNTQGFAALQILKLAEGFDVAGWGDGSADYLHHLAEAAKVAYADRDAWLTDPRFVDIPLTRLLADDYLDARRQLIDPARARDFGEILPGIPSPIRLDTSRPAGDTCAFSAVDEDGLVVSAIQSLYQDFGSMEVAGDTGILLQNRGSYFSLDDDHPNCLEPGKRTFHTLIPAMLCRDGEPVLAFGTMGGNGQPQTHAALVTRLVDFGYGVQQAIDAPRWVAGRTLGSEQEQLYLEGRIPDAVVRELSRRGHTVRMAMDWDEDMGHAQAIRIDRARGVLEGGADPRGDGAALGY